MKHTIVERADVFWFSDTQALLRSDNGYISVCTSRCQSYFEQGFFIASFHENEFYGWICLSAAISSIHGSATGMK